MKHGYSSLRWSRKKCDRWIRAKRCPECSTQRLMPGPDYDRFRITCMECGLRARVKPPQEALR